MLIYCIDCFISEDMKAVVETYESFKEAMDVKVEQLSTALAKNL